MPCRPMLPILILLLACLIGANDPVATIGTSEDLHKLYTDGKYQPLLQKIAKILSLKGDAAKAYNRYEIFMLRGDAQLAVKSQPLAIEAFVTAQKEASDDAERDQARAIELLIRKSSGLKYKPIFVASPDDKKKSKKDEKDPDAPIDIVSPESRKDAMLAFWADSLAGSATWMNAAKQAKNLNAIAMAAKSVADLHALELAATQKEEKTKQMLKELGDHAADLISKELDTMKERVDKIKTDANVVIEETVKQPDPTNIRNVQTVTKHHKKGLDGPNTTELKKIIDTCKKIDPAVQEISTNFSLEDSRIKTITSDNKALLESAQDLLQTDFRKDDSSSPKP